MAGLIRVTPEQLIQTSAQLSQGASSIQTTLAQLASMVQPLGVEWAGAGQVKFEGLWAQWQKDAAGLNNALMAISRQMSQAAAQYETTDTQVASQFGAL